MTKSSDVDNSVFLPANVSLKRMNSIFFDG